ncbi:MAG: shikimate kinase [Betaproteobacteria bacterium]|nr:shikimate kinase [Betaproteobacteria bacterium]
MKSCENIYFVGMMGAGKTTIGRHLARRLKKRFVDCDHEIEARTGVRIPVIFDIEGEVGFRKRESQVLEALAEERGLVLATGGGAVLAPQNRCLLAGTGLVIYLCVPPDELYARTKHDRNRPLLQVDNPQERIRELHAQRDPLYREIADIVLEGGGRTPLAVARQLEQEILKSCKP